MPDPTKIQVAIVDLGVGNLFSVKHACELAGMVSKVTSKKTEVLSATAIILPGVGAFGEAMNTLGKLDLVEPIKDTVASGTPLIGICLGMQLLMTESQEFGLHKGLSLIDGEVCSLESDLEAKPPLKVPQLGWNQVHCVGTQQEGEKTGIRRWNNTLYEGIADEEFMYFVHSYYCKPSNSKTVLSVTPWGTVRFCSSLHSRNIFGCQFHPERSGPSGLRMYSNMAKWITRTINEVDGVGESESKVRTA